MVLNVLCFGVEFMCCLSLFNYIYAISRDRNKVTVKPLVHMDVGTTDNFFQNRYFY